MAPKSSALVAGAAAAVADTADAGDEAVDEALPALDEVLFERRMAPFRFADLRAYLATEFSQENADMWRMAEAYHQRFEGGLPDAPGPVVSEALPAAEDAAKLVIVDTFVKPGAPSEVNLSSAMRNEILLRSGHGTPKASAGEDSEEEGDGDGDDSAEVRDVEESPALFGRAQREVRDLIERNAFSRFLAAATRNITVEEGHERQVKATVLIMIAVFLTGALMLTEVLVDDMPSPYVRLVSGPLLLTAFEAIFSSVYSV